MVVNDEVKGKIQPVILRLLGCTPVKSFDCNVAVGNYNTHVAQSISRVPDQNGVSQA